MQRTGLVLLIVLFPLSVLPTSSRAQDAAEAELRFPSFTELAQLPAPGAESLLPLGENVLSLAQAEALAVANHPVLRVAEGELRAARGRWVQVGLKPNPMVGYMGEEIGNEGKAGMHGGMVTQEFVTAGKLGLSRATAAREIEAAEQRYATARLQALSAVRSYYFQVLAAQRAVALSHDLVAMANQAVTASEQRLRADTISRAALLQTQIESESVALLEQQAVNRSDGAERRLAAVLGLDLSKSPLPRLDDGFQKPLPALDWESTRARLLAESPELSEARFAVEAARWAVQRAIAGRVPNVNVQAGVQYDYSTQDTFARVQVGVPLPIFDRNQGGIAAAYGELAAAQAVLDQRQLILEQRLAAALRDYLTARQRVEKYRSTILPATQQSLDMFRQAYQQGVLDYLQLITAQRTYTEKHLAYLLDLEAAWQKWAEIEGLLVEPLSDGRD